MYSRDFFLRLFRNYVYYHFTFPKINKRGGWNKSGGLENFSKINKRGGTIIRYSRVIGVSSQILKVRQLM